MEVYPKSFENLLESYKKLPGVGEKSAERMALATLDMSLEDVLKMSEALVQAKKELHSCPICGNLTDQEICSICDDSNRNHNLICVVEDYKSAFAFEKVGNFKGVYHVLNGLISPMMNIGADDINLSSLISRVEKLEHPEIILALKSSIEGETTTLYIKKIFEKKDVMTFDKDENINFHLISKTRDTGYQVMCGGEKYNVDIDALWMNFPQIYDQERQIYVASNHQLYPIYVMNLINNALNEKEVFYILNPYLGKSDDLRPDVEKLYERSPIYAKLAIISSLRWKKKDCTWDNSVLRGLSKYDEDILNQLYDEMTLDGFDEDNFEKDLGQFLNYDTTIQHNMNTIKRLVKARNLHN